MCQGQGCNANAAFLNGNTRREAKNRGWTRKGGKDYCPKCPKR